MDNKTSAGMSSIRDDYIAPWWTYWLHNFPHVNLNFQPIDNTFTPQDQNYQQVSCADSDLTDAGSHKLYPKWNLIY